MEKISKSIPNLEIMNGKPYIRGMRVGIIIGLVASGRAVEEILQAYPTLEATDIDTALVYAASRVVEIEFSFKPACA